MAAPRLSRATMAAARAKTTAPSAQTARSPGTAAQGVNDSTCSAPLAVKPAAASHRQMVRIVPLC